MRSKISNVIVAIAVISLLPLSASGIQSEDLTPTANESLILLGTPSLEPLPEGMAPNNWPQFFQHQVLEQLGSYLPQLVALEAEGLVQDFQLDPELNAIRLVNPQAAALEDARSWPGVTGTAETTTDLERRAREQVERSRSTSASLQLHRTQAHAPLPEAKETRSVPRDVEGVQYVTVYQNESRVTGQVTAHVDVQIVLKDPEGSTKAELVTHTDGYLDVYLTATILGEDTIEITPEGEDTVSIYVTPMTGVADKVTDTVSGTAAPNSQVTVQLVHYDGVSWNWWYKVVVADVSGRFLADFSGEVDIHSSDEVIVGMDTAEWNTIRIQFHVPGLYVSATYDSVRGYYYPPNAPVHIILKDSLGKIKEIADTTTSYQGSFSVQWACNDIVTDIGAGDRLEVTMGSELTVISVPNVTVNPDASSDTVAGTGPPGAKMEVNVQDAETSQRAANTVFADGNGDYLTDFGGTFDIGPGDYVYVIYHDGNDNEVDTYVYVPSLIRAQANDSGFRIYERPGANAVATLKNALGAIKATASGVVDGSGYLWLSLHDSAGNYVSAIANDVLEVSVDEGPTQAVEIVPINFWVDRDNRIVSGYALPNTTLLITANYGGSSQEVMTGADGYFEATFSYITGGYAVNVYYSNTDGNQLEYEQYAPQFTVTEMGENDSAYGYAVPNTIVLFTLKDGEGAIKGTATKSTNSTGYYWLSVLDLEADIAFGDRAEMASGPVSTSLEIVELTITGDRDTNYVYGTAPPSAWLNVFARRYLGGLGESAYKYFYADPDGNFATDFGGGFDVRGGDTLEVLYWDGGQKDRVSVRRYLPNHVRVVLATNVVGGYAEPGASGSVVVKDSGGIPKATVPVSASSNEGWFGTGVLLDGLGNPIDLVPGDVVEVDIGTLSQTVHVPVLDLSFDLAGDIVGITGPANQQLALSIYHWRDTYYSTYTSNGSLAGWVATDSNGHASFDCQCLADLTAGDYAWLYYLDGQDNYVYDSFPTTWPTATTTAYPSAVQPFGLVTVYWTLADGVHPQSTYIRWDTVSHAGDNLYLYSSNSQTGAIGTNVGSFTAPAAGTIYFKVYAYVDGNGIYSDEHTITVSGEMATTIIDPVSGTTNELTPVLTGVAPPAADVEIYEDETLLATGSADGTGRFAIEIPAPLSGDGELLRATSEHAIHAQAIVGGVPQPDSNTLLLTVDPSLIVDPVHIMVTSGGITQHLRDEAGLANLGGQIWTRTSDPIDVSIPISCTEVISANLLVGGLFASSLVDSGNNVWVGTAMPPATGYYAVSANINCDGEAETVELFSGLIDPDGYVYDASLGVNHRVAGATVTCYELTDEVAETWQVWNGAVWGQQNPQVVGSDGYYSFFTLPGQYYVEVTATRYRAYQSPVLEVVNEPVHHNVPLEPLRRIYLPLVLKNW